MKLVRLLVFTGLLGLLYSCNNDGDSQSVSTPEAYLNPAVAPYTEKIRLNSDDAEAYYERAMALANVQSDSLAIVDFEKALSFDEANFKYIYRYANFLFEIGEFKKAADEYEKLINIDPRNEDAILGIVQTYIKLEDAQNAHKYLDPPLRLLSGHPVLTYLSAEILLVERDTARALDILTDLLKKDDAHYEAQFLKGEILARQGSEASVKYFQKAFRLDTLDVLPFEKIGDFYYDKKEYNQAINYYRKAVTADLNYEYGFYKVGRTYQEMDSLDKALSNYNLALRSNVRLLEAYLGKASVFEKMNLKDSAVLSLQTALQFHPKSTEIREALEKWK